MVQEVETNRLIHLFTPLFFGWTISFMSYAAEHSISQLVYDTLREGY